MKSLEIHRVLIVDDEPDLCELLSKILEDQNILTACASNGKEALELLRIKTFHAVLCDIMMPQMTGLQCLEQALTESITTPFVFITGFSDHKLTLQAIRLGAVDFISKPFDNQEIVDVVYRVLEINKSRNHILQDVQKENLNLFTNIAKEERKISLLKVHNNRKRTA